MTLDEGSDSQTVTHNFENENSEAVVSVEGHVSKHVGWERTVGLQKR